VSVLAEIAQEIKLMSARNPLLGDNSPIRILDVEATAPATIRMLFSLRRGGSDHDVFEYQQPHLHGLLDEVVADQQSADVAAMIIVSNLCELVEASDMGIEQAIRAGVVRKVSGPGS
jgi:hypothetical protein